MLFKFRWCSDRVYAADVTACLIRILFFVSQGAVIGIDDEDDSTFTITVDQKTFHFQGELKEEIVFFFFLIIDSTCIWWMILNVWQQNSMNEHTENILDPGVLQVRQGFASAVDTYVLERDCSSGRIWRFKM